MNLFDGLAGLRLADTGVCLKPLSRSYTMPWWAPGTVHHLPRRSSEMPRIQLMLVLASGVSLYRSPHFLASMNMPTVASVVQKGLREDMLLLPKTLMSSRFPAFALGNMNSMRRHLVQLNLRINWRSRLSCYILVWHTNVWNASRRAHQWTEPCSRLQ